MRAETCAGSDAKESEDGENRRGEYLSYGDLLSDNGVLML